MSTKKITLKAGINARSLIDSDNIRVFTNIDTAKNDVNKERRIFTDKRDGQNKTIIIENGKRKWDNENPKESMKKEFLHTLKTHIKS